MDRKSRYLFCKLAIVLICSCWNRPAIAQDSNCARVTVQIEQSVTIARSAFRGSLEINNGLADTTLQDVQVVIDIRDAFGEPANDKFAGVSFPDELDGIGDVSGSGSIPPDTSVSASWIFIPKREAAPLADTEYDIGGELTYTQDGEEIFIPFFPERITVRPDPLLDVKYFWERDVFADDPFTEEIEPSIPFSLGLMMHNLGAGVARDVRVTTSQPQITENIDGLLIDFQIIGTQLGSEMISPTLNVNFGDIAPNDELDPEQPPIEGNDTAVARFLMTSTLQGQFTEYSVSYEHVTDLGDPRALQEDGLSLIADANVYELIHVVRAENPIDDGISDFMTNQYTPFTQPLDPYEDPNADDPDRKDLPDTLHLSDATVEPITPVLDATVSALPPPVLTAMVTAIMPEGWSYVKFEDPFDGDYPLASVERTDGSQLLPDNYWQTDRIFIEMGSPPLLLDRIHIFDRGGDGQYLLRFEADNEPPEIMAVRIAAQHGDLGAELALTVTDDGLFSDSRGNGVRKILIGFNEPIAPGSLNLLTVSGIAGPDNMTIDMSNFETTTSTTEGNTTGIVEFEPALPDYARFCVELFGVTDVFGNPLGGGNQIIFTTLAGDVNGDRQVNALDAGGVVSLVGTDPINPTSVTHIRSDINQDRRITNEDIALILEAAGTNAQAIPIPCESMAAMRERNSVPTPTLQSPVAMSRNSTSVGR
jgi:Dockerin type I domain